MGELRFGAAFPISEKRENTESSIKLSGIRFSGQSEKWMPEGKRNEDLEVINIGRVLVLGFRRNE